VAVAAPSARAADRWRVSGALSGTYDNSTSWTQCTANGATGSAAEHVDVDVRLRTATSSYERGNPQFGAVFKLDLGGRWTLSGSYAPRHRDVNGNESCGAPVPFACGGGLTSVTAGGQARIIFIRRGRAYLGQLTEFAGVREEQSGQPSPCNTEGDDDSVAVLPLFGLATGGAASNLVSGLFRVPITRLRGRRAFSVDVMPASGESGGCDEFYLACSESSRLTFTLRFTPKR
jgi:hypothetical protein